MNLCLGNVDFGTDVAAVQHFNVAAHDLPKKIGIADAFGVLEVARWLSLQEPQAC